MPSLLLSRLPTAMLLFAALIMTQSCARESAPGEVMLLVSTNLSVSNGDVDTLQITVIRDGSSDAPTKRCYWLRELPRGTTPVCPTASLPGTIALVSKDATSGQTHVHLELLQGGAKGAVRVQRDAELQIPSEGVKQLPMSLDFLCLDASLPDACPAGTTCQAGSCVDDKIGQLADYVATPAASACFDVETCFGGFKGSNSTVPRSDTELNRCTINGNQALGAVNVNVALIVNRTMVGNYGVCDDSTARCLIPLNHGPEGWQTLRDVNGVAAAIGLPDAVCSELNGSILGVVVSSSGVCTAKDESVGLCAPSPESPTCIDADKDKICPDPWHGFSCSGTAAPPGGVNDWCSRVHADPMTGPVVPGLWCCVDTSHPRRPSPNPLLIDDMSADPMLKIEAGEGLGVSGWFTATDDVNAVLSPPPFPAMFTYRAFDPAVVPSAGASPISRAACLRSEGFSGYAAMEGFGFLHSLGDNLTVPLDVSPYTGLRFWAYSVPPDYGKLDLPTEIRVEFVNVDTAGGNPKSACVQQGDGACDNFGKFITLPNDGSWASYTIKWADLEQGGWGYSIEAFDTHVDNVVFVFSGVGPDSRSLPFDFCIAQIEFTQD